MKHVPRLPIPWDMVVFLTITTAGFGFSVHRLVTENPLSPQSENPSARSVSSLASPSHSLDLGCVEKSLPKQRLRADQGTVRFTGSFCHLTKRAMHAFLGVRVRNRTNGYEGTVFLRPENPGFMTDTVHLNPGSNEIEIEWRENASAVARSIIAEVTDR